MYAPQPSSLSAVLGWACERILGVGTLGIILNPDHVGEGIGPRALRLALSYGFRQLGLNRVELRVWAFNSRAIRAYEKVGFQIEGRRREIAFHDGRFHDELIMGVLAREF